MRRWLVAVLGVSVGIGAACSTFSGDTPEPTADGGDAAVATDAPIADAAQDVVAVTDADAAVPVPPCPDAAFCDDFERTANLSDGWSTIKNTNPGTLLTLSSTRVLSGFGALRLDIDKDAGATAFLQKTVNGAPAKLTLRFSVYYDVAPERDVVIAAVNLGGPTVYVVALPQGNLGIADQVIDGGTFTKTTPFDIAIGKWRSVEVSYTSGNATIDWNVDGVIGGRPAMHASGQPAYFQVGAANVKQGNAMTFHFDHVVVQTE